MKLSTRCRHSFTEISVDKISETMWKEDEHEIDEFIFNLFSVIEDLASMNNRNIEDYLKRYN